MNADFANPEFDALGASLAQQSFFDHETPITGARVLARLDVMGGIADYSGSNVCQALLARGIVAAVQSRADDLIRVRSQQPGDATPSSSEFRTASFANADYAALGQSLRDAGLARYPLAALLALFKEQSLPLANGFNILLISSIPMNVGIASSGAVEIATLASLNAHLQLELSPLRLAQLGQLAENRIVGAPCGIMDQIAIACGNTRSLTHILCRPGDIVGDVAIPPATQFVGVNSSIRHSVAASPYAHVRIGAFMGRTIINALRVGRGGRPLQHLAELTPEDFDREYAAHIPDTLTGQAFLGQYQSHGDAVTTVDGAVTYRIAGPTRHPIEENARVLQFINALQNPTPESLHHAGTLMFQAHDSYRTLCRLSTPEVDALVESVRAMGPTSGLYGAKITGGGAGGTVAIFGNRDALAQHLPRLTENYAGRFRLTPQVFLPPDPASPAQHIARFIRADSKWNPA